MTDKQTQTWAAAAVWVVAGVLAWASYAALTAVFTDGKLAQVFLGLAMVVALVIGTAATVRLVSTTDDDGERRRWLLLGGGWGVAAVAGWNIAVMVGGPASGLVSTIYAQRYLANRPWHAAALLIGAIVLGRLAMELPGGTELLPGGLWTTCAIAFGVSAVAFGLRWIPASAKFVAVLLVWGGAWVFAYWVKNRLGVPALYGYGPNAVELIIAFGIGGAFTGEGAFSGRRLVYWALGGAIAAAVGVVIDIPLTWFLAGETAVLSGQPLYGDAGQAVGMAVGAMFAVRAIGHAKTGAAEPARQ